MIQYHKTKTNITNILISVESEDDPLWVSSYSPCDTACSTQASFPTIMPPQSVLRLETYNGRVNNVSSVGSKSSFDS